MTTHEKNSLIREIRVHLWLRCFSQRARERSIRLFIHRFIIFYHLFFLMKVVRLRCLAGCMPIVSSQL